MKTLLKTQGYVATDKDVAALARSILNARGTVEIGKTTYLRALVATTQAELTPDGALAAFNVVHKRFSAIVMDINDRALEDNIADRATELNRRTNFARTSAYVLRHWLRAGNDIKTLDAATVSKTMLVVPPARSNAPREVVLKKLADKQLVALEETLTTLADVDWKAAVSEYTTLINALSAKLLEMQVSNEESFMPGSPERHGREHTQHSANA